MMKSLLLVTTTTLIAFAQQPAAVEPGFKALFDGKTLDGWTLVKGHGPGYVVKDGVIVCPADGGGNLFTEAEYANFVIRFEFKLSPGGNNGLGIRAPLTGDTAYQGMELQILDHDHEMYKKDGKSWLKPAQYHGSIYGVFPAKTGFLKPVGEWNSEEVIADGRRITIKLNGTTIVDANLDDAKDPAVLKEHPGLARKTGHIGLLGHGSLVEFRNLRIKTL
jgi:hypothetical protein